MQPLETTWPYPPLTVDARKIAEYLRYQLYPSLADFLAGNRVNHLEEAEGRSYYRPQYYGAKADGTTDDTAAVQAAINVASAAGGGTVYLSPATYLISAAIHPLSSVQIVGAGPASIISYSGSGTAISVKTVAEGGDEAQLRMSLRDFQVLSTTGATGIDMDGFHESDVHRLYVNGFVTGIDLSPTEMNDHAPATHMTAHFNVIDHCKIYGRTTSAIGIKNIGDAGYAAFNKILNNTIDNVNKGIYCAGQGGMIVFGNDVENVVGTTPILIDVDGDDSFVSGNWIESTVAGDTGLRIRGSRGLHWGNTISTAATDLDIVSETFGLGTITPELIGANYSIQDIRGTSGGGVVFGVAGGNRGYVYGSAGSVNFGSWSNIPINLMVNNTSVMDATASLITMKQDVDIVSGKVLKVNNTQVVGARVVDARCADVANSGDATTDGLIDSLRDAMIAHGLISAS